MTSHYERARDADAETIADAAMRAYGHPWHARKTLLAQRMYCAEMGIAEPKYLDAAIALLEERAEGKAQGRGHEQTQVYDIASELERMGASVAPSGTRVLCEDEQRELDNWLFAGTLSKALTDIGRAVYDSHIFTLTSKGGKVLYCRCEDYEKAQRTRKGRNSAKVYLCDANGVELTKPAKWNSDYTDVVSIAFGSIAKCERNGLLQYEDYTREDTQTISKENA